MTIAETLAGRVEVSRPTRGHPERVRVGLVSLLSDAREKVAQIVNPPYPTEDGKPLQIHHYGPGDQDPVVTEALTSVFNQIRDLQNKNGT